MTKMPKKEANEINTRLADDSKMAGNESLRELVARGKSLQCEVVQGGVTSTFFLADKKMRSDFSTPVANKETRGHMIIKDDTSYTWMEGEKSGFKVTATEEQKKQAQEQAEKNGNVDLDAKVNYSCKNWSKDSSYFELPGDVDFKDLASMIPSAPTTPATPKTGTVDKCAVCTSVPASAQAQCKASLGCK